MSSRRRREPKKKKNNRLQKRALFSRRSINIAFFLRTIDTDPKKNPRLFDREMMLQQQQCFNVILQLILILVPSVYCPQVPDSAPYVPVRVCLCPISGIKVDLLKILLHKKSAENKMRTTWCNSTTAEAGALWWLRLCREAEGWEAPKHLKEHYLLLLLLLLFPK